MYLAEVKAVAFAVISSGYRSQALLYMHSDQCYIRQYGIHDPTQHYLYPCWVRVDQLYAYHGCTPRGVSILRLTMLSLDGQIIPHRLVPRHINAIDILHVTNKHHLS